MMFSREELGKLFHDRTAGSTSAVAAGAQTNTNIPRLPVKSLDVSANFKPSVAGVTAKPGRYWAGKAPEWQAAVGVSAGASADSAFSLNQVGAGAPTGTRRRIDAQVVGGDSGEEAPEHAGPSRRRIVEAVVVVDEAPPAVSMEASGANEDANRRERVRARLTLQRSTEAREAARAGEELPVEDRLGELDTDDISARVAAALASAQRVAAPFGGIGAGIAADGDGEREEDVAARRARVRARMRIREEGAGAEAAAASRTDGTRGTEVSHLSPPQAPAVMVDGISLRVTGGGRRRPVEALVVVPAEDKWAEGSQTNDGDIEGASGSSRWGGKAMVRPVFTSKEERSTLRAAEAAAAAEAEAFAAAAVALAARADESRALVAHVVYADAAEDAGAGKEEGGAGRPDDTDHPDDEESEMQAWRLRELRRLARDAEAAETVLKEAADTERRRTLSPEDRAREDAALEAAGLKVFRKFKEKWGFLQKYYHKGAFYVDEGTVQDAGDVRKRGVSEATGDDAVQGNKTALPKVMQVRNFGRKGRTRWTHLAAEDTSITGAGGGSRGK